MKPSVKNYADGTSSFRETVFPFTREVKEAEGVQVDEGQAVEAVVGVERCESSLVNDIALLKARLHEANSQLEQADSDFVKQGEQLAILARGKEETVAKVRNMERKNAAMKRRSDSLEW